MSSSDKKQLADVKTDGDDFNSGSRAGARSVPTLLDELTSNVPPVPVSMPSLTSSRRPSAGAPIIFEDISEEAIDSNCTHVTARKDSVDSYFPPPLYRTTSMAKTTLNSRKGSVDAVDEQSVKGHRGRSPSISISPNIAQNQVISNLSIFKPINAEIEPIRVDNPKSSTVKSFATTDKNYSTKKQNSRKVSPNTMNFELVPPKSTNYYDKPDQFSYPRPQINTEPKPEPTKPYTFIHIPRRWLSLRNVIACSNVLINFVAILVISTVSYLASYASTNSAIAAMSRLTLSDIQFKLDSSLALAEQNNVFTEDAFRLQNISMDDTVHVASHFLFLFAQQIGTDMDQIYAVSPNNLYNGVAKLEAYSQTLLAIKFISKSTIPRRLQILVNETCNASNMFCQQPTNLILLENSTYYGTGRPFYKKAIATKNIGWTDVYSFATDGALGITSVRPVYSDPSKQNLLIVAAVDIKLTTLSKFLKGIADELAMNSSDVVLWMMERDTGYLVASSDPDNIPLSFNQTDGYNNTSIQRIGVLDSSNAIISSSARYVITTYGSFTKVGSLTQNRIAVMQMDSSILVVGSYFSFSKDIQWLIYLHVPIELFQGQLNRAYLTNIPLVTALVLIISILVSVVVTRAIGRPLKKIARKMMQVADLNFDVDSDNENAKENNEKLKSRLKEVEEKTAGNSARIMKDLISFRMSQNVSSKKIEKKKKKKANKKFELKEITYINSAMSSLTSGLKSFSKYVPLDVVTLLVKLKREAVLGVDENELTIMFTDIANFTQISETMQKQDLVTLMGEYFKEVSDIILDSQGTVDKYIGDAVMAFWNAPISMDNHAAVSCGVALNCQQRLKELQQMWIDQGFPLIQTRIGINTGISLVGNFGAPDRLNYTCLGDSVNLASRLEGLNKVYKTDIIISDYTYQQVHNQFVCRPLDLVAVKGKSIAVQIYELIEFKEIASEDVIRRVELYTNAYQLYLTKNFAKAKLLFQEYLCKFPNDVPTMRHIEHCEKLIKSPPQDPDWSPVIVFHEK